MCFVDNEPRYSGIFFFLSLGRLKHNIDNEYDRLQLAAGHAHCLMSPP